MRKIIIRGHAKTVGTDFTEAVLYRANTLDSVLEEDCFQASIDNASMYGWDFVDSYWEPESEDPEEQYEEWLSVCTDDELGYTWEEYDSEKHDMLRIGGGSFEDDFAMQMERMNASI